MSRSRHNNKEDVRPALPVPDGLTPGQLRAWQVVCVKRANLFLTGRAGCGKSFIVRAMVDCLRHMHGKHNVFVTASTGVSAVNVHGTTLHSFGGIGLGKGSREQLLAAASKRNAIKARWRKARVLIIDEISMIDADLWESLDFIARSLRRCEQPFGGLQVLVVGDFFQLPPVPDRGRDAPAKRFAFQSPVWDRMFPMECTVDLRQQMRQDGDAVLSKLLNTIRIGVCPKEAAALFETAGSELKALEEQGIKPTRLFARNREVDALNRQELALLDAAPQVFDAADRGSPSGKNMLRRNCRLPTRLTLKLGAQVMLLKNLNTEGGLVNGTQGTVVSFVDPRESTDDGEEGGDSSGGLSNPLWPVVRFVRRNATTALCTIEPTEWDIVSGDVLIATRSQLPLRVSYAITIHKSQGMTIDALDVDLEDVFAAGQAYVGLSRGVSLARMRVRNFCPAVVHCNREVMAYYIALAEHAQSQGLLGKKRGREAENMDAEEGATSSSCGAGAGAGAGADADADAGAGAATDADG